MKQTRDTLKTYFETGDKPTESEFGQFIDSYAHLNEFNFGLSIKPSGTYKDADYHFYRATDVQLSGAGHITVEASGGSAPESINGYNHILSRYVLHKTLEIKLIGEIDITKHKPKIIVERYRQRKKYPSGYIRPAGFYKENTWDAELWNRKSEYDVTANEMNIDLKPINYFRPNLYSSNYEDFIPSGSLGEGGRPGSFKYSRHAKPFVPIQFRLQISIDGIAYQSQPVGLKIILGSSGKYDAINFVFNALI